MRAGLLTLLLLLIVGCLVAAVVVAALGQWTRFWSLLVIALLLYVLGCIRKD